MYISIDALLDACHPPCDPQFVPMQFDEKARTKPNATCCSAVFQVACMAWKRAKLLNRQSFRYLLQYAAFFAEMKARRARRAKAADLKSGSVVSMALNKPVNTRDSISGCC
jgi:hypothetical protein